MNAIMFTFGNQQHNTRIVHIVDTMDMTPCDYMKPFNYVYTKKLLSSPPLSPIRKQSSQAKSKHWFDKHQ